MISLALGRMGQLVVSPRSPGGSPPQVAGDQQVLQLAQEERERTLVGQLCVHDDALPGLLVQHGLRAESDPGLDLGELVIAHLGVGDELRPAPLRDVRLNQLGDLGRVAEGVIRVEEVTGPAELEVVDDELDDLVERSLVDVGVFVDLTPVTHAGQRAGLGDGVVAVAADGLTGQVLVQPTDDVQHLVGGDLTRLRTLVDRRPQILGHLVAEEHLGDAGVVGVRGGGIEGDLRWLPDLECEGQLPLVPTLEVLLEIGDVECELTPAFGRRVDPDGGHGVPLC